MNRFSANTTRLLAATFALLLGSTAAFAELADYQQLSDSLKSQLTSLHVPTGNLGLLSTIQLVQLTALLSLPNKDVDKAFAAEVMLDEFLHPSEAAADSPEGLKLAGDLKAMLAKIDVAYPAQPLTTTQMQALINSIISHKNVPTQKQSIEAVLAEINRPASVMTTNAGVMQMEADIDAKLSGVGITPPAVGTMTFEQLGKLEGVFSDATVSDADKKSGAMKALGLN